MPYLKETARSVLKLNIDYEWIIYDNFSEDDTRSYLRSLAQNNNVKVFFNDQNLGGPFPNFAKGIVEAKAKHLLFLDSDDILGSEHSLSACIEALELNQNIFIAISEVAYMSENGTIYKHKKIPFTKNRNFVSGKKLFWIIISWPTYPTKFGAMVIQKDLFKKIGSKFDINLVLEASKFTSFALIKEVGLNYRNRAKSSSSKQTINAKNVYLWYFLINKFLPAKKYFIISYFFLIYKVFIHILKIIYRNFSSERI
jgi:hypothetical protein